MGQQKPRRQARMQVLDVEQASTATGRNLDSLEQQKANEPPEDAWWVFVMSFEPAIGSGRYGYYEDRPKVITDDNITYVEGKVGEPIMVFPHENSISVYVAQMRHTMNPTAPMDEGQAA